MWEQPIARTPWLAATLLRSDSFPPRLGGKELLEAARRVSCMAARQTVRIEEKGRNSAMRDATKSLSGLDSARERRQAECKKRRYNKGKRRLWEGARTRWAAAGQAAILRAGRVWSSPSADDDQAPKGCEAVRSPITGERVAEIQVEPGPTGGSRSKARHSGGHEKWNSGSGCADQWRGEGTALCSKADSSPRDKGPAVPGNGREGPHEAK